MVTKTVPAGAEDPQSIASLAKIETTNVSITLICVGMWNYVPCWNNLGLSGDSIVHDAPQLTS